MKSFNFQKGKSDFPNLENIINSNNVLITNRRNVEEMVEEEIPRGSL
jgi:hypothetical protein